MESCLKKALSDIEIKSNKELSYPYILDKDPAMAAQYLTIEDCEAAFDLLTHVYKAIDGTEKSQYKLLEKQLRRRVMFQWFAQFYKELAKLMELDEYYPIPEVSFVGVPRDTIIFYPPLKYQNKKIVELKFPPKIVNTIDKYRCLYIKKKVSLSEFRTGYPAWYSLSDMELFEEYNIMTNVRVRINFVEGEFRYYIAGASDNWKEIRGVPLEMDHIVSALMFRN